MCHSLTPLVTHASRRKVLRCSCGSLHVVWDNLNLSLTPEEFTGLRGVVVHGGSAQDSVADQWHLHHGTSGMGLWYGPLGTTFSLPDFAAFVSLISAVQTAPPQQKHLYALN